MRPGRSLTPSLSRIVSSAAFPAAAASLAALAAGACGPPAPEPSAPKAPAEIACPRPIGTIRPERCSDVADEFDVVKVDSALKSAGTDSAAESRIEAIKATSETARLLREERVRVCEAYNACRLAPKQLAERDARLADGVTRLLALWRGRQLGSAEEAEKYKAQLFAIRSAAGLPVPPAPVTSPGPPPEPPVRVVPLEAVVRGTDPQLRIAAAGGHVEITSPGGGIAREAARVPAEALGLVPGKRQQVRIAGAYTPAAAALVQPGDELGARLAFRAIKDAEIVIALRSLDDPDAMDTTTSFKVKARERGAQNTGFVAAPNQSGHYLAVAVHGGPVDIDDVELLRGGAPIAAARAESKDEPHVATACKVGRRPLSGRGSFECTGSDSDALTIGKPSAHLLIALRDATGEHAVLRTLSLEGGRTLDVTPDAHAEVVFYLVGAGKLELGSIEVRELR